MNLDDHELFKKLDTQNMLREIDGLPDQLKSAWELGQTQPLPDITDIQRVVITGMGGSAIGADLVTALIMDTCPVPVTVHRDYGLPAFAKGKETLVIASSHSGNTEETLDAFDAALKNKCTIIAVCTGGELAKRAKENNIPAWTFDHRGQPRAAVGFSFGLLLSLFARLKLIPNPVSGVEEAIAEMKGLQECLHADVPAANNPAKRRAGQLMGRWVTVMGAGILAPVARRWKGQVNEIAKAGANFEYIPEADHNTLAGTVNPAELLNSQTMTIFLRSPSDHPRNKLRLELTRRAIMLEGMNTDVAEARGKSPISHMWTLILLGDYTAYYLAMAYGMDPTPVVALENFKKTLKEAK
jgi:glucose/mannose-6-phosphate isomerase